MHAKFLNLHARDQPTPTGFLELGLFGGLIVGSMEPGEVGIDDRREAVDRRGRAEFDDVELAPGRRDKPHAPARRCRPPSPPPPGRWRREVGDESSDARAVVCVPCVAPGASREPSESGHRHHRRDTTRSRIATRPSATLATRSAQNGTRGPNRPEGGTSHPRASTRLTTNPKRPVAIACRSDRVTTRPRGRARRVRPRCAPRP